MSSSSSASNGCIVSNVSDGASDISIVSNVSTGSNVSIVSSVNDVIIICNYIYD